MEVHPGCRVEAHKFLTFPHQGIQDVPIGVGRVPERVFVPVTATGEEVASSSLWWSPRQMPVCRRLSVLELSKLSNYNRD